MEMASDTSLLDINSFIASKIPPLVDPYEYCTPTGLLNLVFAPFIQGLFQGLGEGLAKVIVGRWVLQIE